MPQGTRSLEHRPHTIEMEETYARLQRMTVAAQDGINEVDFRTGTVYYSQRWREMTQSEDLPANADDETRRRYWWQRIHPDDREALRKHLQEWQQEGKPYGTITYRLCYPDGSVRWFMERGHVERETDGTPRRATGVLTDITEQKTLEQKLAAMTAQLEQVVQEQKATEREHRILLERYQLATHGTRTGLWEWDVVANQWFRSPEWKALLGYTTLEEQAQLTDIRPFIHPEDIASMGVALEDLLAGRTEIYDVMYRIRHKLGHFLWFRSRATLQRHSDGSAYRVIGVYNDISSLKQQEEALRRSEERYRALVDAAFDGVWTSTKEGILISVSQRMQEEYPLPRSGDWRDLIHPDDRRTNFSHWQEVVPTGQAYEDTYRMRNRHGEYRWRHFRSVPVRHSDGTVREWVGTVRDVTEQVVAEQALRESETRLKEAQRITKSGSWEVSLQDRTVVWSDEMFRIYERDFALGPPSLEAVASYHPLEQWKRIREMGQRVRATGVPEMMELPLITERGTQKWIQIHLRAESHASNEVTHLFGAVIDITAFKQLEEELRQTQQFSRRVALAVPDTLYVYDRVMRTTRYRNRSLTRSLGLATDDAEQNAQLEALEAESLHDYFVARLHPEDLPMFYAAQQQLAHVQDGEVVEMTLRLHHKDGQYRTVSCRELVFQRDEEGHPAEILGVAQDISPRREVEISLRHSEEKYRGLVSLLSDWVWECDARWHYSNVSHQVMSRLGYLPEEMFQAPLTDFVVAEDKERLHSLLGGSKQQHEGFSRIPVRMTTLTGEVAYLELSGVPLRDEKGVFQGYRGVAHDVTERKQAEDELRNNEEWLRRIIESSPDAIHILDKSGCLLLINEVGRRFLPSGTRVHARNLWKLFWEDDSEERASVLLGRALAGATTRFTGRSQTSQETQWWDVMVTPLMDTRGFTDRILIVSRDITDQKIREAEKDALLAEAMKQAERDPLTGLLDHKAFHLRLQEESRRADREQSRFAVAVLDVDNFKYFNDAFGHLEGDAVLLHITEALRANVRKGDTIGRLGGDEFAILLPDIGQAEAMQLLEEKVRADTFTAHWRPVGQESPIPLRISFGVAVYPDDAHDPISVLALADERLYRNKQMSQAGALDYLRVELSQTLIGFPLLDSLVTAVDNRDRYTRKHSEDVLVYALLIGQEMNLSQTDLLLLRPAALLHDVGKIGVSAHLLRMPTALTPEEYEAVKHHALLGASLIELLLSFPHSTYLPPRNKVEPYHMALPQSAKVPHSLLESASEDSRTPALYSALSPSHTSSPQMLADTDLKRVVSAVRHHHEAWNGSGYPSGLSGEDIPLLARVLAVADAFSALTTDRPYRRGMTPAQALKVLRDGAGKQWDSTCVAALERSVAHTVPSGTYAIWPPTLREQ